MAPRTYGGSDKFRLIFETAFKDADFYFSQTLIWAKNQFTITRSDYKYQYEPCIYGWKQGAAHYFIERFDQSSVIDDIEKIDKMKKDESVAALKDILNNNQNDIIRENKPNKSELHPTMKPASIFARHILNSSKPGEIVLDPFAGSGTTIIVAEQCGRKARVIELEPHYCDVIIARWEEFTGGKAERIK